MKLMLKAKSLILYTILLILVIFAFLAIGLKQEGNIQATTPPLCTPDYTIISPGPDQEVSGEIMLEMYASGAFPQPQKVYFFLDDNKLGAASVDSSNIYYWGMPWDTRTVTNGDYQLYAKVIPDMGDVCLTEPRTIFVNNDISAITHLAVLITSPESNPWEGPVNVNVPFYTKAMLVENISGEFVQDVTEETIFEWTSTIGSVYPEDTNGRIGKFVTGPVDGSGKVKVLANYGSQTALAVKNVVIHTSTDEETPPPDDGSTGGTSSSGDDYYETTSGDEPDTTDGAIEEEILIDENGVPVLTSAGSTITIPPEIVQERQRLSECLIEKLGEDDYLAVAEDRDRMSSEQFDKAFSCFAERRFVIPASSAPVDPNIVKELVETKRTKVEVIRNVERIGAPDNKVIEFSGVAEPNRTVLIYVFSEPLVLATQTDSNGNWTYTLEDPLEPGDHEVYVAVESPEDGAYVRSGLTTFAVTDIETSDENPFGYSLTLAGTAGPNTITYYILGVVGLVLAAAFVLVRFVWLKPANANTGKAEVTETQNEEQQTQQ